MVCKQRKVCNMCEAPFKMTRGCLLEKRCPACRLLGIQDNPINPYYMKRWRILIKKEGSKFRTWCFYDQVEPLHMLYDMLSPKQMSDDIMDSIIKEDNREHMMEILNEHLSIREKYILLQTIDEYTYGEIATVLNITRERVRQILNLAIKKIKHPRIAKPMKEFKDDC